MTPFLWGVALGFLFGSLAFGYLYWQKRAECGELRKQLSMSLGELAGRHK